VTGTVKIGMSKAALYRRCPVFKGGDMNRLDKKEIAPEAAKLFEEEVLALKPDIPREQLCDMVDNYIYYQTDDMSKEEAHAIVDVTCVRKGIAR
jgi:hypothetical protein